MGLRILDRKSESKLPVNRELSFEEETKKWFLSKYDYNEEKLKKFVENFYNKKSRLTTSGKKSTNAHELIITTVEKIKKQIANPKSDPIEAQKPIDIGTLMELLDLNDRK